MIDYEALGFFALGVFAGAGLTLLALSFVAIHGFQ